MVFDLESAEQIHLLCIVIGLITVVTYYVRRIVLEMVRKARLCENYNVADTENLYCVVAVTNSTLWGPSLYKYKNWYSSILLVVS